MQKLNSSQQTVAESITGPVIVVAGPGTGKTFTLVQRIKKILEESNLSGKTILVLTFSHKAKEEILSRVYLEVGKETTNIEIETFHSFCLKILLRKNSNLQIADEVEQKVLLNEAMRKAGVGRGVGKREVSLAIGLYKSHALCKSFENNLKKEIRKIADYYGQELLDSGKLDFDDVLIETLKLFNSDRELLRQLRDKYRHLMIDEFQDTNEIQLEILVKLTKENPNICVIGDPLQSIYGFRGAVGDVFERFKLIFPDAKELTLDTNYRSCRQIIKASQTLFPDIYLLKANFPEEGCVKIIEVYDSRSEADFVTKYIQEAIGGIDLNQADLDKAENNFGSHFRSFAVIFRLRRQVDLIKRALEKESIPYQILGEDSLFAQPWVVAFSHIVSQLNQSATSEAATPKAFPGNFYHFWFEKLADFPKVDLKQLADLVYYEKLLNGKYEMNEADFKKFSEWLNKFASFETPFQEYLDYYDLLVRDEYFDNKVDRVTLSTIHGVKGLEFDHVIIPGFEEGILPCLRVGILSEAGVSEEKRLLYVAMTRARKQMVITHAQRRFGKDRVISRFAKDIAKAGIISQKEKNFEKVVKRVEKRKMKSQQTSFGI